MARLSASWLRRIATLLALTLALMSLALPILGAEVAPTQAQADSQTFPETGQTVSGKFLDYWKAHGGLAQQGYPLTGEQQEISPADGKTYTVQYFERAVFELHPENAGTPYEVLLALLGRFEYQRKYPSGAAGQQARTDNAVFFQETGKTLGGQFRAYWESHGGLAQQGYPISDEFQETSDLDGKTYIVQYFERAVFELHPENQPPYNILLSQLGTFAWRRQQGQASPTPSGPAATATAPAQGGIAGNFPANGKSLYIQCLGKGAPTIVLETGQAAPGRVMRNLQLKLAERTMTCAYDRANIGVSSRAPKPRTGQDIVEDLHALLAAAQVPGPYVLVGQSVGGEFVQLYARTYDDQVVGVVSMNPGPPARRWLDEVSKIFTPEEYAEELANAQGQNAESIDSLTTSDQLTAAPAPPNVPFEMFISTIAQCGSLTDVCGRSYPIYERIMQEVAAAWPQGHFSQVVAGHDIFRDDVDAVVAVVERVLPRP